MGWLHLCRSKRVDELEVKLKNVEDELKRVSQQKIVDGRAAPPTTITPSSPTSSSSSRASKSVHEVMWGYLPQSYRSPQSEDWSENRCKNKPRWPSLPTYKYQPRLSANSLLPRFKSVLELAFSTEGYLKAFRPNLPHKPSSNNTCKASTQRTHSSTIQHPLD